MRENVLPNRGHALNLRASSDSTELMHGCAVPVVPIVDTVKEVKEGRVVAHPNRDRLRAAQTPQVVHRNTWLRASTMDSRDETDDAAMVGRTGQRVVAVEGDPQNIKITRPEDLQLAELILAERGRG